MPNTPPPAVADAGTRREVTAVTVRDPDSDTSWREDEVDLSRYWRALGQRWRLIAAGALIGTLFGIALALRQPIVYEAVTTLLVDRANSPTALSTSRALLQNYSLAEQTVNETGLNRPPNALTPQAFVNTALQIEEVRGTSLLRVRVVLPDPKRAADASRLLSTKAVALNRQIVSDGSTAVRAQLKVLLDESAERLKVAEQQLIAYQADAQVDLLKTDTDALLDQRAALPDLQVQIEKERATLRAAEQELQKHSPLVSAPRAVAAEEALMRAVVPPTPTSETGGRATARSGSWSTSEPPAPLFLTPTLPTWPSSPSPPSSATSPLASSPSSMSPSFSSSLRASASNDHEENPSRHANRRTTNATQAPDAGVPPLDLSNAFVNPVYQTLAFQIATSRTRLAALERQRQELIVVRKLSAGRLRQFSDLYRKQTELSRLKDAYDLARRAYADVALRYEQSRAESIGDTVQLQIVDPAIPPDRALPRKRVQSAGLGFTAGLLLAALAALVVGTWSGDHLSDSAVVARRRRT